MSKFLSPILGRPSFRALLLLAIACNAPNARAASIRRLEPVRSSTPTPYVATPTIAQTATGLVVAWIGGSEAGSIDSSVWISRQQGSSWTQPEQIFSHIDPKTGFQYPCWNPVLFQPAVGPLLLFYHVGRTTEDWRGMLATSKDHGRSWSKRKALPRNHFGPTKNQPVELPNGRLLCGSDTRKGGWTVHLEIARPFRRRWLWSKTKRLNHPLQMRAIEPTILAHSERRFQVLCRTKQGFIAESWSLDGGKTWSNLQATRLPNPNASLDAVKLRDGQFFLVYHHGRSQQDTVDGIFSRDGKEWSKRLIIERIPGQTLSGVAVIQGADGMLHVVYCQNHREIRHAVINPS